jgi:hypothetical protein
MPAFVGWVNGHAYDGGGLTSEQRDLRDFYAALLKLCQDPSVRADGYWGLKYFNRPERFPDCPGDLYSFARFEPGGGRVLLVAANFQPGGELSARVRIPADLAVRAALPPAVTVRLVLDRGGAKDVGVAQASLQRLLSDGIHVTIPDQTAHVYAIT